MANYNLSLPAETIDSLLLWLDDKQDVIIKQTDLLSGTGQSTTATMTQKAITDALGTKADASNVYTKTQTDTLLNAKADKSTTYTKTETDTLLNNKVDKETGKGLSTNDYTDADKTKLGALPTAAELDSELAVLAGEAGPAEAVIDTDNAGTEQEFTFRKSGGDGGAYYRKIKGKTLVANQWLNNWDFASGALSPWYPVLGTETYSISDGVLTLSNGAIDQGFSDVLGHKYLAMFDCKTSVAQNVAVVYAGGNSQVLSHNGNGNWQECGAIIEATPGSYYLLRLGILNNDAASYKNTQIIDLTQWFGVGNEPTTIAEFKARYPNPIPTTPGTLISNDAKTVETTGVNQWDEEWESGTIDDNTGENSPAPEKIRVKNFIPAFPATQYFVNTGGKSMSNAFCYDAEKYFIGTCDLIQQVSGNWIVETLANTAFIKVAFSATYGTTYNHDICINISNPAINGQYFPYWKRTLHLGLTTKEDTDGNVPFADGMKGAGTAADWADKVGGEKRMGRVDLGSLEWIYGSEYAYGQTYVSNAIPNIKIVASNGVYANMLCQKYVTNKSNDANPNNISYLNTVYAITGEAKIAIVADGFPDIAAFKTAMQGVMLDYELATPVPFTWKEPLNLGVKVDENGTERAVAPEGATAPSAPFVADTTYTMSVARMVEILKNL